jgi:hypothetical protein
LSPFYYINFWLILIETINFNLSYSQSRGLHALSFAAFFSPGRSDETVVLHTVCTTQYMASCGMGCHACLASICAIPGDPSPPNHGIWWYYSFSTEVDRPGTLPSVLEMQTIE